MDLNTLGSSFLGYLAWYVIPNVDYDKQSVNDALTKHGFDSFTFDRSNEIGAFTRSCNQLNQHKHTSSLLIPANVRLYARQVTRTSERILFSLQLEQTDTQAEVLDYHEIARIQFDIKNGSLAHQVSPQIRPEHADLAKRALDLIIAAFTSSRKELSGNQVSNMAINIMRHAGGVQAKRGVTYFPPSANVKNITEMFRSFKLANSLEHCDAQWVPLIEVGDQLDLVKNAFVDQQIKDLQELYTTLKEVKASGNARQSKSAKEELQRLEDRRAEYEQITKTSAETLGEIQSLVESLSREVFDPSYTKPVKVKPEPVKPEPEVFDEFETAPEVFAEPEPAAVVEPEDDMFDMFS